MEMKPTKEDIKKARNVAGLTQAEAADVVHVSVDTWRKWEQGSPMNLAAWELFGIKVKKSKKKVNIKTARVEVYAVKDGMVALGVFVDDVEIANPLIAVDNDGWLADWTDGDLNCAVAEEYGMSANDVSKIITRSDTEIRSQVLAKIPKSVWMSYTDFTDENDEIGYTAGAYCYPSLRDAVNWSDVKEGECSVVMTKHDGVKYYAVVYPVPTSWKTTVESLKENDCDPDKLKQFEVLEGNISED